MNKTALLLLLVGSIQGAASGQTSVTLEECIALARQNSPALRVAEGMLRSAELATSELSTTGLPQLKVVAGAGYAPVSRGFGYDPALSNGGQLGAQIVLQQSLYDGGVRSVKSDQLRYDHERFDREQHRTERDIVFSVRQTFIEALRAQNELQLQHQSVAQLGEYLGLVRRLFNGGSASYTDVLKTNVQFSNSSISLQKAGESLSAAMYSLAEITGIALDSSVTLSGSLDSLVAVSSDSTGDTGNPDLAGTLDVSIAELLIRKSLLDAELARRELFPVLTFAADAGYLGSMENIRLPVADRFNSFGYSVGIGIQVPLFTWGGTGLRVEQRTLEADGLRFQLELLRRSIKTEYRKAQLQLVGGRKRLRDLRANIANAFDNYLLTKSKFASGVSLSIEVLSAQQLLSDARLAELQTLADIQLLSARLERLGAP